MTLNAARQRGAAALLLILVLLIAGSGLYFGSRTRNDLRIEQAGHVTERLKTAKQELVAFALAYDQLYPKSSGPGHLPCPDVDGNGNPDTPCGPTALGRLPKSAPTAAQSVLFSNHDSRVDRQFWYAVADPFRDNPPNQKVNSNSPLLRVNERAAVAVLMEPGEQNGMQNRSGGTASGLDAADYLEGENADGDAEYAAAGNDRLLAVLPRDVYPLLQRLVARELRDLLKAYRAGCGVYPAPVPYADPETITAFRSDTSGTLLEGLFPRDQAYPETWGTGCAPALKLSGWIVKNGWLRHIHYAVAPGDPCTPAKDCLTVVNGTEHYPAQGLLIFPGTPLDGQTRLSGAAGVGDYLEGGNATALDGIFEQGDWGSAFNDELYVVD